VLVFIIQLHEGSTTIERLVSKIFPQVSQSTATFNDKSCSEFSSGKIGIEALMAKESDISLILDMPWTVRRCLAEGKLPDAIKVLQVVQDCRKSIKHPPEPLKVSLLLLLSYTDFFPLCFCSERAYIASYFYCQFVIQRVCDEVMELKSQIQQALLLKLSSSNVGLSECLQTVSLLRSFFPDDTSLRLRFLQSRMKDIPWDQWRSYIFDTLTQHRAAFGGDSNHILSSWMDIQIQSVLMAELHKRLNTEPLDSLLTTVAYYGESLARVGADLRGLLVPVFRDKIVSKFNEDLVRYEVQFARNLQEMNLSTVAAFASSSEVESISEPTPDLTPPKQLITHQPLGLYLNGILRTLNDIVSKNPLLQAGALLAARTNESVMKVAAELDRWGKVEGLTWEIKEQTEFNRMKRSFQHLLVPHLDHVFRILFPPSDLSKLTGVGIAQCADVIHITCSV